MELIYLYDAYRSEINTRITGIRKENLSVQVEDSVFYPGGGGQPADTGHLLFGSEKTEIVRSEKQDNGIWYILDGQVLPEMGAAVSMRIDWDRRYQLMRTHTAMHILSGVIWRDYQAKVTGGNMEPLYGRMDFEFENMSKELVNEIEIKINQEVANARKIEVKILPREEANKIPDLIRTKVNLLPVGLTEIRTVNILGLDLQADGGTHVRDTSEVGNIRITEYKSKGRINKRVKLQLE